MCVMGQLIWTKCVQNLLRRHITDCSCGSKHIAVSLVPAPEQGNVNGSGKWTQSRRFSRVAENSALVSGGVALGAGARDGRLFVLTRFLLRERTTSLENALMRRQARRLGRELFVLRLGRQRVVDPGVIDRLGEQSQAERRQRALP